MGSLFAVSYFVPIYEILDIRGPRKGEEKSSKFPDSLLYCSDQGNCTAVDTVWFEYTPSGDGRESGR